jgi:hypothetical protein
MTASVDALMLPLGEKKNGQWNVGYGDRLNIWMEWGRQGIHTEFW